MVDEHVKSQHRVVGRRNHVVVVRGEHASREAEHRRVQIGQVLQNERAQPRARPTSDRMKKEEALQAVTLLYSLADTLLDLLLVEWSILMVPTRPIVSSTRIVTDALSRLKDVFQLAVQDLVIDYSRLHVDDYCSRF